VGDGDGIVVGDGDFDGDDDEGGRSITGTEPDGQDHKVIL
jgi:hypothetical protein